MTRKKTAYGLVAALTAAALLVGGVAIASNMGFKFVPNLPVTAGANGYNLSLPWWNQYTDAASLFNDLATYGTITQVSQFQSDATWADWLGPFSFTTNFTVQKGEAYAVYASGATPLNPVVVGSHDPNYTYTFTAGGFNAAAPYHQTYTIAHELWAGIDAHCPGKLTQLSQFQPNATWADWFGPFSFTTDFGMNLGEGVAVYVNDTCAGFVWAHH